MSTINLTNKEFENLITKGKVVGEGTDGVCYAVGKKVYKIYHKSYKSPLTSNPVYDEEKVRIAVSKEFKGHIVSDVKIIQYTDSEGIRLSLSSGLEKIVERGKQIHGSILPQGAIYVNGRVKGCIYPYYTHVKSIYSAFRKLYKKRLEICRKLIVKVEELLEHNIYPIDLCQKGKDKLFDRRYCNVFLDSKNEPIIIDLDGKSALYTETDNILYEKKSCTSLSFLIFELITREDIQEDYEAEDYDSIRAYLCEIGLPERLREKFLDQDMSIEDIKESFEIIKSRKNKI